MTEDDKQYAATPEEPATDDIRELQLAMHREREELAEIEQQMALIKATVENTVNDEAEKLLAINDKSLSNQTKRDAEVKDRLSQLAIYTDLQTTVSEIKTRLKYMAIDHEFLQRQFRRDNSMAHGQLLIAEQLCLLNSNVETMLNTPGIALDNIDDDPESCTMGDCTMEYCTKGD